jgi:signal peptidase
VSAAFAQLRWTVRLAALAGLWTAVGLAVGIVLAVGVPWLLGAKSLAVMSGSMAPAVETGDVVVTETISPTEARVGDVVTFRDPRGSERLITHRLHGFRLSGGRFRAVTKGDANNTVERWSVPSGGQIGRVVYRVPKLGYATARIRSSVLGPLLLSVSALGLALLALTGIWRPAHGAGG